MSQEEYHMNRVIILFVISFFISLDVESAVVNDKCRDRDQLICINTIKKYPYTQLMNTLKKNSDFFIAVLTYNSDWGMYPSYIYIDKPIQLYKGKANIIAINNKTCSEIYQLIDAYIDFDGSLFIKHGENSFPAMFHVVVVYKKGKITEMILSQLDNTVTDKYENDVYADKPFIFLAKLADVTNTPLMFESIYGFSPIILKK